MARTESTSFQVHPNDEQNQINLMQLFHWSLLNSQEIKTVDSHLEQRGDDIYSVTDSEHYVKLTFSRELDLPNINEIKQLEESYFSLPTPKYPRLFPGGFILWLITSAWGFTWFIYLLASYIPKKKTAEQIEKNTEKKQQNFLSEVTKYN